MVSVSAHLPSSFSFAIASNPRRDLSPSSSSSSWIELSVSRKIVPFPRRGDPTSCPGLRLCASKAEVPARRAETFDPELRLVLELATDAELIELEHILFGPSEEIHPVSLPSVGKKLSNSHGSLEVGLSQWKVLALGALRGGAKELQHTVMKLARKFSGKMLLEAANYEIKHEIIKRGGQLAAINLESKAAELAARQGLAHAASKYLGLRSVMMILGPDVGDISGRCRDSNAGD
ncbi:PHD-finger [Musa troglodytarum]|uniref:PHD-finger n=1 Tax=Musa troglodytarum TaxID=320322 RepID=A0A9E7H3T8_9LILI|nr:PHD-finger [Musa troglodytarum]